MPAGARVENGEEESRRPHLPDAPTHSGKGEYSDAWFHVVLYGTSSTKLTCKMLSPTSETLHSINILSQQWNQFI